MSKSRRASRRSYKSEYTATMEAIRHSRSYVQIKSMHRKDKKYRLSRGKKGRARRGENGSVVVRFADPILVERGIVLSEHDGFGQWSLGVSLNPMEIFIIEAPHTVDNTTSRSPRHPTA